MGVLCVLLGLAADCNAQLLPWNIRADSQVRVQYLFGTQIVVPYVRGGLTERNPRPQNYRIDTEPRFPVIEGEVEIMTGLPFSARGLVCTNILDSRVGSHRTIDVEDGDPSGAWNMTSKFSAWEVAGLYHIWEGGGYRFTLLGGYRYEHWLNSGSKTGGTDIGSDLDDKMAAYMPFVGLQTTMAFPLWRSRFEILGSFFMRRTVDGRRWNGDSLFLNYSGYGNAGGFVDLRMTGTVRVSQWTSVGLDGRFSYQEVYGRIEGNRHSESVSYDVLLRQVYGTVGMVFLAVF